MPSLPATSSDGSTRSTRRSSASVPSQDRTLFAFASYNAGPNRIRQLRLETKKRGLNPNLWFNNVEQIVSEKIGRETVTYVANIYKYYIAYTLAMELRDARAKGQAQSPS